MRTENMYYEVLPKIVPAGRESAITVRPLYDHRRFRDDVTYQVAVIPAEGIRGQTGWIETPRTAANIVDGILRIAHAFDAEQEYALLVETSDGVLVAEFRLYALEPDLFACRPYKGDIHMHTSYSDGKESPAYVAACCRRTGFDFAAITDHRQYAPSLEAIRAFEGVDTELRLYPGEEVHAPDNPVHIIHFGGRFSVNDLFSTDAYRTEVDALAATMDDLPQTIDRYTYASCVWCFNKIREAGGLAVFCHPYWFTHRGYDVPVYLTDLLFERQPYDALEVIGGYHMFEVESNTLQVARYHEERAKGRRIPIVGVSDAHGCENAELFGWYYTIVFAPSADLPDLVQGIKDLRSVAVEALPDQPTRAYGPFRLVKYAQYLFREVFPLHDELCREEGRLMLAHIAGDGSAAGLLNQIQGRTAGLYERMWGAA